MNDDFIDFLNGSEEVPQAVYDRSLKYLLLSMSPRKMLFKFYFTNALGALLTILVCPQYGFGPIGGEEGILSYVMDFGPAWCGIFCASVFFAGGNFASLVFLKDFEKEWLAKHKLIILTPWISLVFFIGMIAKYYAPNSLHHNTVGFHLSWYLSALMFSYIFFTINSGKKIAITRSAR